MNIIHKLVKRFKRINIVKVFTFNALSTLIRMMSGLISVKVVATIVGPSGIALLGQLNNFASIMLGLANGGINSGVTKYIAEYKGDYSLIKKLLSNALRITIICSFITGCILILGSQFITRVLMHSEEYGYVFIIFGFTIILYSLNTLLISILNGYKNFKKYVVVNICGTILGLIFSVSLVVTCGLAGAMVNAVTFQSIMFFVTLWFVRKEKWFCKENFCGKLDQKIVKQYLAYSAANLTAMFLFPIVQILMRGYVISLLSITHAGWWEAMNRISSTYLSVITTSFAIYYLPRLSEIKDKWELRCEILKCYKFIVPMLLVAVILIYTLRFFLVDLLFTPKFYPMENLFVWQLIGDVFKIMSWLLAYQMGARAQIKLFIATEIIFNLLYVLLSCAFIKVNGIVGLTQAYMVNYIIYFITMIFIYKNLVFMKSPSK